MKNVFIIIIMVVSMAYMFSILFDRYEDARKKESTTKSKIIKEDKKESSY